MGDNVKVDPVDLFVSASFTDQYADELHTACTAATSAAQSSQGGWVGASSGALGALVTDWEDTTNRLHQTLTAQAENLRSSANRYIATDQSTSSQLQSSGDALPRLNLD